MKLQWIVTLGVCIAVAGVFTGCQSADTAAPEIDVNRSVKGQTNSAPNYWNYLWINGSPSIHVALYNYGDSLRVMDGDDLRGFEVAGKDRVFFPAKAEITDQITESGKFQVTWINLTSDQVDEPFYIRYAVGEYASKANLVNASGEPALPFQTHSQCAVVHPK